MNFVKKRRQGAVLCGGEKYELDPYINVIRVCNGQIFFGSIADVEGLICIITARSKFFIKPKGKKSVSFPDYEIIQGNHYYGFPDWH